jgi:hypothetical protein
MPAANASPLRDDSNLSSERSSQGSHGPKFRVRFGREQAADIRWVLSNLPGELALGNLVLDTKLVKGIDHRVDLGDLRLGALVTGPEDGVVQLLVQQTTVTAGVKKRGLGHLISSGRKCTTEGTP